MQDIPPSLPPGQHALDSPNAQVDPILFALERLQTHLMWIDEYHRSFEKLRDSDPASAEIELGYLRNSTHQAVLYLQRLTELLLAGCNLDPHKQTPKGLNIKEWQRFVNILLKEQFPRVQ